MPAYPWLFDNNIDTASTPAKINAMRTIGVPYEKGYEHIANGDLMAQAEGIRDGLAKEKIKTAANKEIIAIIAYLQRLGKDIKTVNKPATASN